MGDPAEYGETWAEIYDEYPAHPTAADAEPAAEMLAALASGRPVLEFGVGTGRIALPLAARGVDVHGIDASAAMLRRLAAKPGGDKITVVVGDIQRDRVDGTFGLVFAAFNTLVMIPTQEGQVRCFRNAAAHLAPGGLFVAETFVPDFAKLAEGSTCNVRHVDEQAIWLLMTRHEPLQQLILSQTVRAGSDGIRRYPITLRYIWPAELDLMARLAGFRLNERHADWRSSPFRAESRNQVSIYQLVDLTTRNTDDSALSSHVIAR